jgi:oligopeptide/dipeptide ABC transporter ATP-binding protein
MVEAGPVKAMFDHPAHPYTRALLESIPRMSDARQRLTAIDGQPPDLARLPAGCAFQPRCPVAVDRCRTEAPPDIVVAPSHAARCWLASPGPVASAAAGRADVVGR